MLYATNQDSAIPTGRVSSDAISIKIANEFIRDSLDSYKQIDSQTDTTYVSIESYTTDYGEEIAAYSSGTNNLKKSYGLNYTEQHINRNSGNIVNITMSVPDAVPPRSCLLYTSDAADE